MSEASIDDIWDDEEAFSHFDHRDVDMAAFEEAAAMFPPDPRMIHIARLKSAIGIATTDDQLVRWRTPISRKQLIDACTKTIKMADSLKEQSWDTCIYCSSLEGDENVCSTLNELTDAIHRMIEIMRDVREKQSKLSGRLAISKEARKKDFIVSCTRVWMDCGYSVKTTSDGRFAEFLRLAYKAAFHRDVESSSKHLTIATDFVDSQSTNDNLGRRN